MNRKVLFLRIFSIFLLIATVSIFIWELQRTLATPSQDDIFGHTGTVFIANVILLAILVVQWEFYRSFKYFFADGTRTTVKTVSNALAAGLSALMLVVSAVTYLFFMERATDCIYCIWWAAGTLVCNRLAMGIYIEGHTPWDENRWINLARIVKNVLRYLILIPLGFGCFVEFVQLLSMLLGF